MPNISPYQSKARAARGLARPGVLIGLACLTPVVVLAWQAAVAGPPGPRGADLDRMTQVAADAEVAARAFGRQHTPSPVIFPDQHIPIRFSHEVHVALVECKDCHGMVSQSVRGKDVNLPREEACLDCHDAKAAAEGKATDPPASCDTCHPGFVPEWLPGADFSDTSQVKVHPPSWSFPEPNLKFNHKIHVDKGVGCGVCHQGVDKVGVATRDNALPLMGTCLTCHDGKEAADDCKTCHLLESHGAAASGGGRGGRMQTKFDAGTLEPAGWYFMDAHDDDWLQNHRQVAVLGDGKCENCHSEKYCLDCHNGISKPLKIHPNDWISQHPTIAKKNEPECGSCHRSQTFCVDCHQATRVAWEDPNRPSERVTFHPEGWVEGNGVRGANHHAFQAQRNIRACASCHTEATCVSCHSAMAGSRAIDPHPPGWSRSRDCERMRDKNERVCYKCHTPTDQAMRCGF